MKIEIIFLTLFFIFSIVHVVGEYYSKPKIRYITKPFLMPLLVFHYVFEVELSNFNWWLVTGLILGFGGDVFLMIPDPEKTRKYLRLGLVSFLLGHICYIVALITISADMSAFPIWGVSLMIPFILLGIVVSRKLIPLVSKNAESMKIPVIIYIVVIALMGISSILPLGTISIGGFLIIMCGAYFFIISDTINAFNKFGHEIKNERIYTMTTYILGQLLISTGFIFI